MKKNFTFLVGAVFVTMIGFSQTINTFPYNEDFENEPTCSGVAGAACPLTGDFFNATVGDDVDWTVDAGGTASGSTGPSVDFNLGTAGGQYVYVETSAVAGNPNSRALLESPWFNFTGQPTMALSFAYHAFGTSTGNLYVTAKVTQSGTLDTLAGPITDNLDQWQELTISLSAAYGGMDSVQIQFDYISGTSFTGDIALDDIIVGPPIRRDLSATNITIPNQCAYGTTEPIIVTVCNLGDTTYAAGSMIPVSYALNGGLPVMENIMLTAPLSLDSCVDYTFTTLADISAAGNFNIETWTGLPADEVTSNDTTSFSGFNSIGNNIPYFENFEAGQMGWAINNNTAGSWDYGTPANTVINGAASGNSAFATNLTGAYNGNEDGNVTSPCIDISGATGAEVVSMKVWWSSENSWDGANLFTSVDAGATWQQVGAFGDPNNWYTDNSINAAPNGSQEGWTGDFVNGSSGWVVAQNAIDSAMLVDNTSLLLRIGFGSDGSVNREGFAFDDVAIGVNNLTYDFGTDSIMGICDTEFLLDAGAGFDFYHWAELNNNNFNGNWSNDQTLTAISSGSYVITVADSTGMSATDTVYVEILEFQEPNLMDLTSCVGDTVTFDANGGANSTFIWSTGDSTQISMLTLPGMINVIKTDTITGCSVSDTAMFNYSLPLLGADISICLGDTAILDGTTTSASSSYLWNTGDSTAIISVTTGGTFSVSVMDTILGCMTSSDTVNVIVNAQPILDLGPDIMSCDAAFIDAADSAFASYNWTTGDTTAALSITMPGTVGLTIVDNNGCSAIDSINITINVGTLDLGPDTVNCDNYVIDATMSGAASYLWSTLDTTSSITVNTTGIYVLAIVDSNGCVALDSIDVTIDPCTGIGELSDGVEVNLYPNPTKGNLTLSLSELTDNGTIVITNIYGQVVREEQVNSTTTNLDLTNLSNGTYTFRLQINESIVIDKFIINR